MVYSDGQDNIESVSAEISEKRAIQDEKLNEIQIRKKKLEELAASWFVQGHLVIRECNTGNG